MVRYCIQFHNNLNISLKSMYFFKSYFQLKIIRHVLRSLLSPGDRWLFSVGYKQEVFDRRSLCVCLVSFSCEHFDDIEGKSHSFLLTFQQLKKKFSLIWNFKFLGSCPLFPLAVLTDHPRAGAQCWFWGTGEPLRVLQKGAACCAIAQCRRETPAGPLLSHAPLLPCSSPPKLLRLGSPYPAGSSLEQRTVNTQVWLRPQCPPNKGQPHPCGRDPAPALKGTEGESASPLQSCWAPGYSQHTPISEGTCFEPPCLAWRPRSDASWGSQASAPWCVWRGKASFCWCSCPWQDRATCTVTSN